MAGVPLLKQFCCGCPLSTGSKFVGWTGTILGLFSFILYLLEAFGTISLDEDDENKNNSTLVKNKEINPESEKKEMSLVYAIDYLVFAFFFIILLSGIYQKKLNYYVPWLIFSALTIFLTAVDFFMSIIIRPHHTDLAMQVGEAIYLVVHFYFLLIVYSDYKKQKEPAQGNCP